MEDNEATGAHLRHLLFTAEQADKAGDLILAQHAWLDLLVFLEAASAADAAARAHTQRLRQQCYGRLRDLACHQQMLQQRAQVVAQALQAAGCPEGFRFQAPEGPGLLERLKLKQPFQALLALAQQPAACQAVSRPRADAAEQLCSTSLPTDHSKPGAASRSQASNAPARHPQQGAGVQQQWGRQPAPSSAETQRYAGPPVVSSRGPHSGAESQDPSLPHQPERKRDITGQPKTSVTASGACAGTSRWGNKQPHESSGTQRPVLQNVINLADSPDREDDSMAAEPEQEPTGMFQTARQKLAADQRRRGRSLVPPAASSMHAAGGSGASLGGTQGMDGVGAGRPAYPQARAGGGLSRAAVLAGRAVGQRKQGAASNPRGAFVPPFVRKAAEAQGGEGGGEPEGPLSAKTLALLGGPDGELPEALQKVDPNMVELVCNEILDAGASVEWDDIAGQDAAKRLVQEIVVWPLLNPHLFKGARAPPKGLLLFGPPGTGKTLIGKAIASNIKATFFNISASSLTSKWIGEGEKMVRALFAVAGALQPAVIFIDEIDSILSARKAEGEHEASRRLKTEMLVQMEGCDPNSTDRRVLLVGATNRPEEVDEAARRRMPKQLYIPLPCAAARRQMIVRQLGPGGSVRSSLSDAELDKVVSKTNGYSGSDMKNLIQEAAQGPVREAVAVSGGAGLAQLCEDDLRPVTLRDFQVAAKAQRASVEPGEVVRYEQYDAKHGARYVAVADSAAEMDEDDW